MSKVFAYEVTSSASTGVQVGSCVVDVEFEDDSVRSWHLWNSKTGQFGKGWTAIRRDRLCATCYGWPEKHIRLNSHSDGHGPGEQYQPLWLKKGK